MSRREIIDALNREARRLRVEPAALIAVAEIESGLRAFVVVQRHLEPLIRFEAHHFDRCLPADKRLAARQAGLAAPQAGAISNPTRQEARWQMLEAAARIDHRAAREATSWGLGQIMGAHWAWLGYSSVDAFVAEARSGAEGQARQMACFIERAGLAAALRQQDWPRFARHYNGPAYRRNAYHLKLEAAWRRWSAKEVGLVRQMLSRGASGAEVRQLQHALVSLGYRLLLDGEFGPETEQAVRIFQAMEGLAVDGIAGPRTRALLLEQASEVVPLFLLWRHLRAWFHGR
jgi:murein L,D-transpeptidase YcbB/YkuD